jgi:hypothetical protein
VDLWAEIRAFIDLVQRLPTATQHHLAESGSGEFSHDLAALMSLHDYLADDHCGARSLRRYFLLACRCCTSSLATADHDVCNDGDVWRDCFPRRDDQDAIYESIDKDSSFRPCIFVKPNAIK